MQERPSLQLIVGLGGAAVVLFLLAILGAVKVAGSDTDTVAAEAGPVAGSSDDDALSGYVAPSESVPTGNAPEAAGPSGTIDPGKAVPSGGTGGATKSTTKATTASGAAATAGDRTGISKTTIKWGLHAPVTFDGAPLNLAEDPLEGVSVYVKYLNDQGGVNGRKIEYKVSDDRYTVEGGKGAANDLVNDYKPFFVSGTL